MMQVDNVENDASSSPKLAETYEKKSVDDEEAVNNMVCRLEGTLLRSQSFFPYYMLMALEAGNPLRSLLLLCLYPITSLIACFFSESAAMAIQIFVAVAGIKHKDVVAVSRSVLPKFFLEDVDASVGKAFLQEGGKRYVVTSHPRIFMEHFVRYNLGIEGVVGRELEVRKDGVCTGFMAEEEEDLLQEYSSGGRPRSRSRRMGAAAMNMNMVELEEMRKKREEEALKRFILADIHGHGNNKNKNKNKKEVDKEEDAMAMAPLPITGIITTATTTTTSSSCSSSSRSYYNTFLSICQNIIVIPKSKGDETLAKDLCRNPIIFHDGRLVVRPTPLVTLVVILWLPVGIILAVSRILVGICLPNELAFPMASLLGLKVRVKGAPPIFEGNELGKNEGTLFVCTHRTLADPIFLSMALRRRVKALTYKISKVSELISPIPIAGLTRNRDKDARILDELLQKQDICICPEGTTCREAFLLRFSPLFASLTDRVVPVAINVKLSMFHGTSARGFKAFDGIFYCLNPRPLYEIMFLDPLPMDQFRTEGKTTIEIANVTQKLLADQLGFQCTNYSRKDKYNMLAGHDGNF